MNCTWNFENLCVSQLPNIIIVRKGDDDMSITATELKQNLGKYLLLSAQEDIYITKNGKIIAKLTNPYQNRVETAKSLFGILPKDADIDAARNERLDNK